MSDSKISWLQQLGVETLPACASSPDSAPSEENQSQSPQADEGNQPDQPTAADGQYTPAEDDGENPPDDDNAQSTEPATGDGEDPPDDDNAQSTEPTTGDGEDPPDDQGDDGDDTPDEDNPEEDLYVITFDGTDYYGTKAEADALRERLVAIALDGVCPPLRNLATMHNERVTSLAELNKDQFIVAFFVNLASSADFGSLTAAVAAEQGAVAALEAAIRSNPGTADTAYRAAVEAINASGNAIDAYMNALQIGAGRNAAVLQVIEVSAFAIAAACGGILLAPAGATAATIGSGAAANAGFGALQALAEQGAKGLYGDFKGDFGGAAIAIGKAALLNGIGSLLGSAAGTALKGKVVAAILSKYPGATEAVTTRVTAFVEGAIGNAVQTVISGLPDVAANQLKWGDLAILTAENMLAGGLGNIIGPMMPRTR